MGSTQDDSGHRTAGAGTSRGGQGDRPTGMPDRPVWGDCLITLWGLHGGGRFDNETQVHALIAE